MRKGCIVLYYVFQIETGRVRTCSVHHRVLEWIVSVERQSDKCTVPVRGYQKLIILESLFNNSQGQIMQVKTRVPIGRKMSKYGSIL